MPPTTARIPAWADPQNASVLDNWWTRTARTLGGFLGAADPTSQAMAIGAPVELPGGGASPAQNVVRKTLKAFHGSPHDFDQFSLAKVGTGEGGQAYGHGLYFAENPAVAAEYRKTLSRAPLVNPTFKGSDYGQYVAAANMRGDHGTANAAEALRNYLFEEGPRSRLQHEGTSVSDEVAALKKRLVSQKSQSPGYESWYDDTIKGLDKAAQDLDVKDFRVGRTYEVNLHTSPDELLDWDKPLSQQSPKVQEALKKLKIIPDWHDEWAAITKRQDEIADIAHQTPAIAAESDALDARLQALRKKTGLMGNHWAMDSKGEDVYKALVQPLGRAGHTEGIASQKLKDAGIKGIQYLDQGSRGRTGGELVGVTHTPQGWQAKVRVERGGDTMFTTSAPHATEAAAREWADKAINTGTKNFVIFDDKIIEIRRKYGVSLPVAAEIYKWQQSQQKQQKQQPRP